MICRSSGIKCRGVKSRRVNFRRVKCREVKSRRVNFRRVKCREVKSPVPGRRYAVIFNSHLLISPFDVVMMVHNDEMSAATVKSPSSASSGSEFHESAAVIILKQ